MHNINQLRADTPFCERFIHLNNAGSSLTPEPVQRAITDYLAFEAQTGGYEAADAKAAEIQGFYTSVAALIGADSRNIAFACSATDAYSKALSCIPWQAGDLLLTTTNDYVSNQLAFLSLRDRFGIRILRAADLPTGGVDIADMERLILKHKPLLVAVTHVPTSSGLVQNIAAIGAVCKREKVWYLVDACQSIGQIPLDVAVIGCDFLTATFRKFLRGPRGTGFLFASDRALSEGLRLLIPDMKGHNWTGPDTWEPVADAHRYEHWEMSPALMLGSKAAADYALGVGVDWIQGRVSGLATLARHLLANIDGVRVLDYGHELCGIVTAHHPSFEGNKVRDWLRIRQVHTSISTRNAAQFDFGEKNVDWALRLSPHYYNTEDEILRAVEEVEAYVLNQ